LNRARRCAELTLPYILPPAEADYNTELYKPYQALGSLLVESLASKLWLTTLPPSTSFFRLSLSAELKQEIKAQVGEINESDIQVIMQDFEELVNEWIRNKNIRSPAYNMFLHLLITGNALVYLPPDKKTNNLYQVVKKRNSLGMKLFRLDQYVVKRDSIGNLLDIITKEKIGIEAVPEALRPLIEDDKKEIYLYTRAERKEDKFVLSQEIEEHKVPDVGGEVDFVNLPFVVLRASQDGDYGRGMVEKYLGDFETAEDYSKALKEGALGAAKLLFMVDSNGITKKKALTDAKNMDVITGRAEDVSTLRVDKYHDFSVAQNELNKIERRLSQAFLLKAIIQRDGERVTATEIRELAQELEDSLGGLYSLLAEEFQLPLVQLSIFNLQEAGTLPSDLPEDAYTPVITTGLEALGRTHEQAKLKAFAEELQVIFGPEATAQVLSKSEYAKRTATNMGIQTKGLVKSEKQLIQEQQAALEAQAQAQGRAEGYKQQAKGEQ
jgi:hypothetical protein